MLHSCIASLAPFFSCHIDNSQILKRESNPYRCDCALFSTVLNMPARANAYCPAAHLGMEPNSCTLFYVPANGPRLVLATGTEE
jgi:hypothetical protein